ncbi:Protein IN2-1 like B [Apostasia shenzhenica]|uniref:Protein IN2-1 like B n=1 Tax=Apostasia shenzhenica TaxID=1088818 RepID=A0A2H9ZSK4_9ASPA|nr:Protein IN2-1 like B [Apostasia shenzhenica]
MTMVTGFSPLPLAAPNLSSPALARARFRLSASLFLPLHISSNQGFRRPCPKLEPKRRLHRFTMAAAIVSSATEELPSILDSTSEPPSLFDGTASCQVFKVKIVVHSRAGVAGEDKAGGHLQNRPVWYKEKKVYPENKVSCLEHNNEVRGEKSNRILKSSSLPKSFYLTAIPLTSCVFSNACKGRYAAFNRIEAALWKFDDGAFFLGQFILVAIFQLILDVDSGCTLIAQGGFRPATDSECVAVLLFLDAAI